jgi:hypothetical protein
MGRPFDPGDAHPIYAMIKVRPIPPLSLTCPSVSRIILTDD